MSVSVRTCLVVVVVVVVVVPPSPVDVLGSSGSVVFTSSFLRVRL